MNFQLWITCAVFLAFSSGAISADFSYKKLNPISGKDSINNFLYITGEIEQGDSDKLKQLIALDVEKFSVAPIALSSKGGNILEALHIAEIVKNSYNPVAVSENAQCASACFFILSSAVTRYMDGRIGIHRPYLPEKIINNLSISQIEPKQNEMYSKVKIILAEQNIPQYLVDKMLGNASNEIYWLTQRDKDAIGFRAPWYEQMLVTRCGLDKKMEAKYFATDDPSLLQEIRKMQHCEAKLKSDTGLKNIKKLVKQLAN